MKTLMVEEPLTTPNPSVYIDYSRLSFLQSLKLESGAIGEYLMDTTLESCLIAVNLFWPDWIDSVGNVNRFSSAVNRFNCESIQFFLESIQWFSSTNLALFPPWLHSICPSHFMLCTYTSILLNTLKNTQKVSICKI